MLEHSLTSSQLTPCQRLGLQMLGSGENIFLTGMAGSGKSYLIRFFLADKSQKAFPLLASTGAAAILIGGRTFHSFFGLGILEGGFEATLDRALKDRRVIKRLKEAEGFILDEVSMIPASALEAAEAIARRVRGVSVPWGGLRVVAVGDFNQLPPVSRWGEPPEWSFRSRVWKDTHFLTAHLNTIVRTQDPRFLDVLNRVRTGRVDSVVRSYLDSRLFREDFDFQGTRLFPRKDATEKFNLLRLQQLDGNMVVLPTVYSGAERYLKTLRAQAPIPETLYLKIGALVMIRQNDPRSRWVNGSLGHVEKIESDTLEVRLLNGRLVELNKTNFSFLDAEGKSVASSTNFPVILAYATTIHKSQGATLDRVLVDLRGLWESGHAYVAMSRVRTGQDLLVQGWTENSFRVDPHVEAFYRSMKIPTEFQQHP